MADDGERGLRLRPLPEPCRSGPAWPRPMPLAAVAGGRAARKSIEARGDDRSSRVTKPDATSAVVTLNRSSLKKPIAIGRESIYVETGHAGQFLSYQSAPASLLAALVEAERCTGGAPAKPKRGDVGVVERRYALEYDCAHALLQMEDPRQFWPEFLRRSPAPSASRRDGAMTVC